MNHCFALLDVIMAAGLGLVIGALGSYLAGK